MSFFVGSAYLGQALLDRVLVIEQKVVRDLNALISWPVAVGQQQFDDLLVATSAQNKADGLVLALGYWAGCRVSDVSWLLIEHTHVSPKQGWLHVGYKGGKQRAIDLINEARKPLRTYLDRGGRDPESPYVICSQRSERLSEAGIHHWFRTLKARATKDQWPLIADITFHDLRHDFAHRAREASWSLEEVA